MAKNGDMTVKKCSKTVKKLSTLSRNYKKAVEYVEKE